MKKDNHNLGIFIASFLLVSLILIGIIGIITFLLFPKNTYAAEITDMERQVERLEKQNTGFTNDIELKTAQMQLIDEDIEYGAGLDLNRFLDTPYDLDLNDFDVYTWRAEYLQGLRSVKEAEIAETEQKVNSNKAEIASLKKKIAAQTAPVPSIAPSGDMQYIGVFKLTAYCGCYSCSEGYNNLTSTGAIAREGVTIAVDPRVIPYGSRVYIEGVGYRIAQDCGGGIKQNRIDCFVSNHSKCYAPNLNCSAKVYLVK